MDKSKIIPIILLLVILGVGFFTFTFYTEKENLTVANQKLTEEKAGLVEVNSNLKYKYNKVEKEKADIARRLSMVKDELSKAESGMASLKRKWLSVSKERDELAEKMKSTSISKVKITERTDTGVLSEDHWVDFVQSKASLEAKFDILSKALFEEKSKMANLSRENKELSIQIDQVAKERDRLLEEIKFKKRTLRIMSMDLVSEREGRGVAVDEVKKLRKENVDLKRELIMANKDLTKLQDTLKDAIFKRDELEDKITDAGSILKEKSLAFKELQGQLNQVIEGGKKIASGESASIELPPIIVKDRKSVV